MGVGREGGKGGEDVIYHSIRNNRKLLKTRERVIWSDC